MGQFICHHLHMNGIYNGSDLTSSLWKEFFFLFPFASFARKLQLIRHLDHQGISIIRESRSSGNLDHPGISVIRESRSSGNLDHPEISISSNLSFKEL